MKMSDKKDPIEMLPHAERPIECTECRRSIAVYYTAIVGEMIVNTCMCAECPVLRHRLHGIPHSDGANNTEGSLLVCGNCGTSLDSVRLGTPLGCDLCYEVFDDVLIAEMLAAEKIPQKAAINKKTVHIGRGLGETGEMSSSLRLLDLNEALNNVLKNEDYEQAALLRDQIKALTEQDNEPKKK